MCSFIASLQPYASVGTNALMLELDPVVPRDGPFLAFLVTAGHESPHLAEDLLMRVSAVAVGDDDEVNFQGIVIGDLVQGTVCIRDGSLFADVYPQAPFDGNRIVHFDHRSACQDTVGKVRLVAILKPLHVLVFVQLLEQFKADYAVVGVPIFGY